MSEAVGAVRMLRSCRADGRDLTEGAVYEVPDDLSAHAADELVRMGSAVPERVRKKSGASKAKQVGS